MGLEVTAFVESSTDIAHQYLDRQQIPFPVIADPAHTIYDAYGLAGSLIGTLYARLRWWNIYREAARTGIGGNTWELLTRFDGSFTRLPGDFILGPDLSVRVAYYGRDSGDFMSFDELEAYLAQNMGY